VAGHLCRQNTPISRPYGLQMFSQTHSSLQYSNLEFIHSCLQHMSSHWQSDTRRQPMVLHVGGHAPCHNRPLKACPPPTGGKGEGHVAQKRPVNALVCDQVISRAYTSHMSDCLHIAHTLHWHDTHTHICYTSLETVVGGVV